MKRESPHILQLEYDVHPGVALVQKWVAELPAKTGRTLEQWGELVGELPHQSAQEKREFLKKKHHIGTNAAWWIVEYAEGQPTWDADPETYLACAQEYVQNMFSGKRAELLPILEIVADVARTLGDDVRICPCKTIVPFYRQRVFAEIKPSTQTRVDLSLALDSALQEQGCLKRNDVKIRNGDRLTHSIALHKPSDFHREAQDWLRRAYERDAET